MSLYGPPENEQHFPSTSKTMGGYDAAHLGVHQLDDFGFLRLKADGVSRVGKSSEIP